MDDPLPQLRLLDSSLADGRSQQVQLVLLRDKG